MKCKKCGGECDHDSVVLEEMNCVEITFACWDCESIYYGYLFFDDIKIVARQADDGEEVDFPEDHIKDIMSVREGADIFHESIARRLREVERNAPHMIEITEPMGDYPPSWPKPIIGAILKKPGKMYVESLNNEG